MLETEARFKETKKHSEILENKVDQVTKEKQIAEKKGAQVGLLSEINTMINVDMEIYLWHRL